jgi:hypothetical protein
MKKLAVRRLGLVGLCWLLAACGSARGSQAGISVIDPGLMPKAAAEATAIVRQVEATSAALQIRGLATALAEGPEAAATVSPPVASPAMVSSPMPPLPGEPGASATPVASSFPPTAGGFWEVVGVSLAAGGSLIVVHLAAPPAEAATWGTGDVSVADESSGVVYDGIPDVPQIGPLIGRPRLEGQVGYVVLANPAPGLQPGALVKVVLGADTFEHVQVK